MSRAELILIPLPGMGHLIPAVELAKRLVARDERVSVTILILKLPFDQMISSYIQSLHESLASISDRINIVELPDLKTPPDTSTRDFVLQLASLYKPAVKKAVEERAFGGGGSSRLGGFILDPFCTDLMSVADEFHVPSYIFFTASAALLSCMLHFQSLRDDHGLHAAQLLADSDALLDIPGIFNRVPSKVLPIFLEVDDKFLDIVNKYREARGIILNSSLELETYTIHCLSKDPNIPPIYPVGPIVNIPIPQEETKGGGGGGGGLGEEEEEDNTSIQRWLDNQLPASVVFLCFGSMGSFGEEQVREVAEALKSSGRHFLWALRRPPGGRQGFEPPSDYDDLNHVLPEGFLDGTAGVGKVIGWAPQVEILSHPAVGGFVSHCGWNSTLESLWFGVPIAAWPMYSEQNLNAFQLVTELGVAVEVRMDYQWDMMKRSSNFVVHKEEIEKAVKAVMDEENPVRNKAKEMGELSRKTVAQGGSTYASLGRFIDDVFQSIQ
ncbi:hypothetical protein Dimus_017046 [Dionaea muscipula]